jgi:hypothetical protein
MLLKSYQTKNPVNPVALVTKDTCTAIFEGKNREKIVWDVMG